ncbi:MAG: T9SS type A sorting domain-containing protein [Bacteroidales bacterium]|jgi:hypothetical protein|nr:T9SS type A sorting domain-containing protein [Bacteroidales bacterium]
MKKLSIIANMALLAGILQAQDSVKIIFTAQLSDNSYIALDSVEIINRTKGWSETIYYPDTVFIIKKQATGINNISGPSFLISQNIPNPFNGNTVINLQLSENENIDVSLYDLNGKQCVAFNQSLQAGSYNLEIGVATPQLYLLTIKTSKGTQTVKMLAQKGNGTFSMRSVYQGTSNLKKQKLVVEKNYASDDELTYVGHCTYKEQQKGMSIFDTLQLTDKTVTFTFPTLYKVGDIYYDSLGKPEGIVWWLADTVQMADSIAYGTRGKMLYIQEPQYQPHTSTGDGVQWSVGTGYIPAFDSSDGEWNTKMMRQCRDTTTVYPGFQSLDYIDTLSAGTDWYIPAIYEILNISYITVSTINPTLKTIPKADTITTETACHYWSSTTYYDDGVLTLYWRFYPTYQTSILDMGCMKFPKYYRAYLRVVKKFGEKIDFDSVNINFTAKLEDGTFLPFDSIIVKNRTTNQAVKKIYNDTVLTLSPADAQFSFGADNHYKFVCFATCFGEQKIEVQTLVKRDTADEWITFVFREGYKVGDIYYNSEGEAEGMVYWLADTAYTINNIAYGLHGKIVSLAEGYGKNGNGVSDYTNFWDAVDSLDGAYNTNKMLEWIEGFVMASYEDTQRWESLEAVRWCVSLGDGWYFPAINELFYILSNIITLDSLLVAIMPESVLYPQAIYWSSTQADSPNYGKLYAVQTNGSKPATKILRSGNTRACLRAVRRF